MSGLDVIRNFLKDAPTGAGVYRMLDANGDPLYVGKAKNLKKRLTSYTHINKLPERLQNMVMATVTLEVTSTKSEVEALLLEANLVQHHQPKYNIELKDNKSFPYIALDETHEFPRIYKHRGPRRKNVSYFGPFASAGDVNKAIAILQRSFLLRPCADSVFANRHRPCLEYQIKRCSGPCVKKIDQPNYQELVRQTKDFLSGKSREVQQKIEKQMLEASEKQDYERAAVLRDRIRALTQIQATQYINPGVISDADVIALYGGGGKVCIQVFFFRSGQSLGNKAYFPAKTESFSDEEITEAFITNFYRDNPAPKEIILNKKLANAEVISSALEELNKYRIKLTFPIKGEKLRLIQLAEDNAKSALERKMNEDASVREVLEKLAVLFGLDDPPQRIEVFDNSHISGQFQGGAMIVAGPEGFLKNSYRKFNIREQSTIADDYAMMREVLMRRYARLKKESEEGEASWPDLVLIDGGPGHYSVARQVFEELGLSNLKFVCVAKGPDRNAGREKFYVGKDEPIQLPPNDPVLFYLQRLRDEAHRFAITAHRAKRSKSITSSPLDAVSGIGAKRKKALLLHFGSAAAVARASVEDIARVEGINAKLAQQIYDQLHSN